FTTAGTDSHAFELYLLEKSLSRFIVDSRFDEPLFTSGPVQGALQSSARNNVAGIAVEEFGLSGDQEVRRQDDITVERAGAQPLVQLSPNLIQRLIRRIHFLQRESAKPSSRNTA